MRRLAIFLLGCGLLAGCSDLSPQQQNVGVGTLGGAAGGAALGAIGGNAALGTVLGAGAGAIGGLLYNHVQSSKEQSYRNGYVAGQSSAPSGGYAAPVYQPPQ